MDPQDLDFTTAMSTPGPQVEPDFAAAMTPKKRGRPRKIQPPPAGPAAPVTPINNISILDINRDKDEIPIIDSDINRIGSGKIKDRLTAQELRFLDICFNSPRLKGKDKVTINSAMLSAGYGDYSMPVRYRIARNIVKRYERGAGGGAQVFRDIGFGPVSVARGIASHAENAQSEAVALNALALAARCQGMTEPREQGSTGIIININTGPSPGPGEAKPAPARVVIPGGEDQATAPPRRPLQISR